MRPEHKILHIPAEMKMKSVTKRLPRDTYCFNGDGVEGVWLLYTPDKKFVLQVGGNFIALNKKQEKQVVFLLKNEQFLWWQKQKEKRSKK